MVAEGGRTSGGNAVGEGEGPRSSEEISMGGGQPSREVSSPANGGSSGDRSLMEDLLNKSLDCFQNLELHSVVMGVQEIGCSGTPVLGCSSPKDISKNCIVNVESGDHVPVSEHINGIFEKITPEQSSSDVSHSYLLMEVHNIGSPTSDPREDVTNNSLSPISCDRGFQSSLCDISPNDSSSADVDLSVDKFCDIKCADSKSFVSTGFDETFIWTDTSPFSMSCISNSQQVEVEMKTPLRTNGVILNGWSLSSCQPHPKCKNSDKKITSVAGVGEIESLGKKTNSLEFPIVDNLNSKNDILTCSLPKVENSCKNTLSKIDGMDKEADHPIVVNMISNNKASNTVGAYSELVKYNVKTLPKTEDIDAEFMELASADHLIFDTLPNSQALAKAEKLIEKIPSATEDEKEKLVEKIDPSDSLVFDDVTDNQSLISSATVPKYENFDDKTLSVSENVNENDDKTQPLTNYEETKSCNLTSSHDSLPDPDSSDKKVLSSTGDISSVEKIELFEQLIPNSQSLSSVLVHSRFDDPVVKAQPETKDEEVMSLGNIEPSEAQIDPADVSTFKSGSLHPDSSCDERVEIKDTILNKKTEAVNSAVCFLRPNHIPPIQHSDQCVPRQSDDKNPQHQVSPSPPKPCDLVPSKLEAQDELSIANDMVFNDGCTSSHQLSDHEETSNERSLTSKNHFDANILCNNSTSDPLGDYEAPEYSRVLDGNRAQVENKTSIRKIDSCESLIDNLFPDVVLPVDLPITEGQDGAVKILVQKSESSEFLFDNGFNEINTADFESQPEIVNCSVDNKDLSSVPEVFSKEGDQISEIPKDDKFEEVELPLTETLETDGSSGSLVEEINTQTSRRIEKTVSETSVKVSETVTETSVRIKETPLHSLQEMDDEPQIGRKLEHPWSFPGNLISSQTFSFRDVPDGVSPKHSCTSSPEYVAVVKDLDNSRTLVTELQETVASLRSQLSVETSQAERISLLEQRIAQQEKELQLSKQEHDLDVRTIATLRKDMDSKLDVLRKRYESECKDKVSMVMKYAISEKERIDLKKQQELTEKRLKDQTKEVENISGKLKNTTTEKSRISLLLEQKTSELSVANKEVDRLKEEINSREIKIKWIQNKVKTEMDLHKECPGKIESLTTRTQQLEEELASALKTVQNFEKGQEESESRKALELKLKEEHSKWILEKHENTEKEMKLKSLKSKNQTLIEENNNLSVKVQNLEQERFDFEQKLTSAKEDVRTYFNSMAELQGRMVALDMLSKQLTQEREKAETTECELERLRKNNEELMNDMASCRNREAEMLAFTQKLTTKNVQLQSEFSAVEAKAATLEREHQWAEDMISNLRNSLKTVEKELKGEQSKRTEECRLLARQVAEKTKRTEELEAALEDFRGEISVLRNKHASAVKELQRELQQQKKKLDHYESVGVGSGSNSLCHGSRTSSLSSLNENTTPNTHTNNVQNLMDVPAQALIDRIVRLQHEIARQKERIEFLEDHTAQLTKEMQKKSRLLQNYILREDSGALTSNSMDNNKAEVTRHGGIMASVYSSKLADDTMSLDLSLEINHKLQAILEDTLMKNITLKENIDILGDEIARLSKLKTSK